MLGKKQNVYFLQLLRWCFLKMQAKITPVRQDFKIDYMKIDWDEKSYNTIF